MSADPFHPPLQLGTHALEADIVVTSELGHIAVVGGDASDFLLLVSNLGRIGLDNLAYGNEVNTVKAHIRNEGYLPVC